MSRLIFDTPEAAAVYLHRRRVPIPEIAKTLHVTRRVVREAVAGSRAKASARSALLAALDMPALVRRYNSGWSLDQLSDVLGISRQDVRSVLLDHNVSLRPPGGDHHPDPRPVRIDSQTYETLADVIVALAEAGMNVGQIAGAIRRSPTYVFDRLSEAGIKARSRPDSLGIDTERMAALYGSIPSSRVLAQIFHVSEPAIRSRLRECGAPIRPRGGSWRMTADQDAAPIRAPLPPSPWEKRDKAIIARFSQGQAKSRIVRDLGVSNTEIDAAIRYHRSPDKTAAEIIRRKDEGESLTYIAARMGIRITKVISVISSANTKERSTARSRTNKSAHRTVGAVRPTETTRATGAGKQ
ncbi:hypothetical protein ACFWNG_23165 [Streptomyces sp. NPDC058391]|uniref:hypothetical protein n=1 Tax=Streptomyces sp. NPDC058391 TaxID=3346476 RepID=UPI0036586A6B